MMPRSISTYRIYIAALKLGIAIIPSSEMLRTKRFAISYARRNRWLLLCRNLLKEFLNIEEYISLTKFVVAGHHEAWISILMTSA